MEKIFIIGASGFAKEVYSLIVTERKYEVKGFIDYNSEFNYLKINNKNVPIFDESEFLLSNKKDINIAIGIGDPNKIKKIHQKFSGFNFPNIISDKANIGIDVSLGYGNIITQNVVFTANIKIGNLNIFNLNSTVGHDSNIGNFNVINPSANISGEVKIGSNNLFGVGSIILQKLQIGSNNIIGGSCLVTKNIDSESLVIGVPGKIKL